MGKGTYRYCIEDGKLLFTRKIRAGKPEFNGGPPTGERVAVRYTAKVDGDALLAQHRHVSGGVIELCRSPASVCRQYPRSGLEQGVIRRAHPAFNGRNLDGWKLTNPSRSTAEGGRRGVGQHHREARFLALLALWQPAHRAGVHGLQPED